ncbi:unnamed protein product [Mesocestoides corti]|uniref:Uncharacterized protein n=1 Tax=Mesocestoides corti TaxID=53468 RepID=A0A0R3UK19_MESCO|nr:unnamed protein product [Mesocestoides corti]
MCEFPSFEDLVASNRYVRERLLSCQNPLLVGLWGFFEKAATGLTRLYKGKLDNCCDNQCLIEALQRIDTFYRVSQDILKCAHTHGTALGHDCRRLLLRDSLLPAASSEQLYTYDVYSTVLQPHVTGGGLQSRQKRRRSRICRRCRRLRCHRTARRPPVKRRRLRYTKKDDQAKESVKSCLDSYDFSKTARELPDDWPVSLSEFSATCPPPAFSEFTSLKIDLFVILEPRSGKRRSAFFSSGALNFLDDVSLIMPSVATSPQKQSVLIPWPNHHTATDPLYFTLNNSDTMGDLHPSSLIDSLLKFGFHSSPKRSHLESLTGATTQENHGESPKKVD